MKYKNYILVVPPILVENGKSIGIESDIYTHFKSALDFLGAQVETVNFDISRSRQMMLNLGHLESLAGKSPSAVILIDGNRAPGDAAGNYPREFYEKLLKLQNPKIVFLPDLFGLPEKRYQAWVCSCDFIIGFHLPAVQWANKNYQTEKFIFLPSLPVAPFKTENFNEFMSRPYDFGYLGSNKNFRMAFLDRLRQLNSGEFQFAINANDRANSEFLTTFDYLDFLAKCKYVFVTRARLYERFPSPEVSLSRVKDIVTSGRFAGRTSEALAAGAVPVYWEPPPPKTRLGIRLIRFRYSSKTLRLLRPLLLRKSGSIDGWPYDETYNAHQTGIAIVRDPEETIQIISEPIEVKRCRYLNGRNLYHRYVDPVLFFTRITDLINKCYR